MSKSKLVTLNGKKLTEAQFNDKKQEVSNQKGVRLVEISPGVYKTEMRG